MITTIKVKDLEGKELNLMNKYQWKNLVVIIYNNDCLGCTGRAIPLAYEFQQKYKSIQVIGIHANFKNREANKEEIKNIFTSGEIPFPIYIDENHQVYDQFNAEGTPQWLLITSKGELYRSIFGSQEGAQNRLFYAIESMKQETSSNV